MSIFDLLKKKKILLSDFSADMTEADFLALLPGFSEHLLNVVQRASIQFYRDIHSHEAGPFPKVKDEFLYLIYFVSHRRFLSLLPSETGSRMADTLHEIIDRRMAEIDRSFASDKFWKVYLSRKVSYSELYREPELLGKAIMPESLPYVFSGFLQGHLDCPGNIVRHHGIQMAGEAVHLLEGSH